MGSALSRIVSVSPAVPIISDALPIHDLSTKHPARSAHFAGSARLLPHPSTHNSSLPLTPPLKRFKLFPKLPAELRLIIWDLALPSERVVRIQDFDGCSLLHEPSPVCRCIGSKVRVPTLLHVCHESRALAVKHYTITFKNRMLQPTYFNPKIDILYFASVDDFIKFAWPVPVYNLPGDPNIVTIGMPRAEDDPLSTVSYPPRRSTDDEHIESKLRHLAIGWTFPVRYNPIVNKTPWEEISDSDILDLIGEFSNLETLFIEDIYFEDTGPLSLSGRAATLFLKWRLIQRWQTYKDGAKGFPNLVAVGSTMMRQMRFRAREARLNSWERLAEHISVPSTRVWNGFT